MKFFIFIMTVCFIVFYMVATEVIPTSWSNLKHIKVLEQRVKTLEGK